MNTVSPPARLGRPIVVVGSLNMDLIIRTPRMPIGGETLTGSGFATLPGGKGANQALACARLGSPVRMIGRVGNDAFGKQLRNGLAADGVNVRDVRRSQSAATGIAMILVDENGQNRIILSPGANGELSERDVAVHAKVIREASMLVIQLEIPLSTVAKCVAIARQAGVPILLNPGPARPLPPELLANVDIIVPNESEAALLTGIEITDRKSATAAAQALFASGVKSVLITLGADGVMIVDQQGARHQRANKINAVDTTAAGDTFIGGLATGLVEGMILDQAVWLGQQASALCVQRQGAQPSIPYRREIA